MLGRSSLQSLPVGCANGKCAPQKVDATSRSNFFKPIFMVQPAENVSRSYPAIGFCTNPLSFWIAQAILLSAVCVQTVGRRSATLWQAPSFARQPAEREWSKGIDGIQVI
jgi:hypothetical protein